MSGGIAPFIEGLVNASEVKKMAAFSTRLTLGQPLHEDEEY